MKILIIAVSLLLSACGTYSPVRCTSVNSEVCDLQKRVQKLESRHGIPAREVPKEYTDQELINEMKRRKLVRTYATPDQ